MNLLVFRKPTKVYRSDTRPTSTGGYSSDGYAWRWYVPEHLKFRASINLLEHMGSIVTPWIDMLCKRLTRGNCSLTMKLPNFSNIGEDPVQAEVRTEVSRSDVKRKLDFGVKDYSQWFPGDHNQVSDALSRDSGRTDE